MSVDGIAAALGTARRTLERRNKHQMGHAFRETMPRRAEQQATMAPHSRACGCGNYRKSPMLQPNGTRSPGIAYRRQHRIGSELGPASRLACDENPNRMKVDATVI